MDPLTHGIVGAAASQSVAKKELMRPAAAAGFVAAMLADLDYYIHIPSDPLFNIEIHRQFTHSLIFIPVGALVASLLLWWFLRKHLTFRQLYICSFAAYATSGLLDSFTSYGTQLLWPFLETRYAWNLVSVVDPILTTGLIVLVGLGVYRNRKALIAASWCWLFLFLAFGFLQKERGKSALVELASQRGHSTEQIVVKPTIGNQVLWRGNYIYNGRVFTEGIRSGLFSGVKIYEGESAELIELDKDFGNYKGTTLYNDLKRFERLSEGFLIRHPDKPEVIGDARYSMLPTSLVPLWGVETDTTNTDNHLPFLYFRDASEEVRNEFLEMLRRK
jgi:inner membrane protein